MKHLSICLASLGGIPNRWDSSLVLVTSIAAVICVLCFTLTMIRSLNAVIDNSSRSGWAIAVRQGADAESLSAISREEINSLTSLLEGQYDTETHLIIPTTLPRLDNPATTGSIVLRGQAEIEAQSISVVTGRLPSSGQFEVAVGALAAGEYEGLAIDDAVDIQGVSWQVVGHITTGNSLDSELITHLDTLDAAYQRGIYSSVRINLPEADVAALNEKVQADPRLRLDVVTEAEFFVAPESTGVIRFVASVVSVLMGLGALVAAISVMFTAVEERDHEIAVPRSMGFSRRTVALTIIVEAITLCLAGSILGLAIAAVVFGGSTFTTGSLVSMSASLDITGDITLTCLIAGAGLGVVGSLLPMSRSIRKPVYEGIRTSLV